MADPAIITVRRQVIEIEVVKDIQFTTTEQLEDGRYVREIRVMTLPEDDQSANNVLSLTIRLVGQALADLNFSSPSSEF